MSALFGGTYSPSLIPFSERLENSAYAEDLLWQKLKGCSRSGSREIIITAIGLDYFDGGLLQYIEERYGNLSKNDVRVVVRLIQWFGTAMGFGFVTGTLGGRNTQDLLEYWCQPRKCSFSGQKIIEILNSEYHPTEMGSAGNRIVSQYYATGRDRVLSWLLVSWLSTPAGRDYIRKIQDWETFLS